MLEALPNNTNDPGASEPEARSPVSPPVQGNAPAWEDPEEHATASDPPPLQLPAGDVHGQTHGFTLERGGRGGMMTGTAERIGSAVGVCQRQVRRGLGIGTPTERRYDRVSLLGLQFRGGAGESTGARGSGTCFTLGATERRRSCRDSTADRAEDGRMERIGRRALPGVPPRAEQCAIHLPGTRATTRRRISIADHCRYCRSWFCPRRGAPDQEVSPWLAVRIITHLKNPWHKYSPSVRTS